VDILEVKNLDKIFGGLMAISRVSMEIREQEICSIIGPNGAGKTTLFNVISGRYAPDGGRILFQGNDIGGKPPHHIVSAGIGRTFQITNIFPLLTTFENIQAAVIKTHNESFTFFRPIARTLMGCPDLLLLDEPCEGLAPLIVKMLGRLILDICNSGNTILLAEQNVKFALEISEYGFIIENGVIRHEGPAADLSQSEEIKRKFLAVGTA
jgi:branched-chain amino acid transport system ATP-binding protein